MQNFAVSVLSSSQRERERERERERNARKDVIMGVSTLLLTDIKKGRSVSVCN